MLLERVFIGFLGYATLALLLCFVGRYVDLDRSWTGGVDDVPEPCLFELALSGEDPVLVVEFSLHATVKGLVAFLAYGRHNSAFVSDLSLSIG